ncbi:hypothetical protein M9Y10_023580 [Tritrichomonas musculus]|uniref:RRM domain-containing protein n=1 Tax=Tritrichomonas musculus TaxID=1915356 RepID=A0ABR2KVR3_9EUKA
MKSNFTNLCIKNLPLNFEKQDLVSLCNQYGIIKSAKIMFDLKTGKSKGFGFVRYQSKFSAALAKEKLNGIWISKDNFNKICIRENKGKKIYVSYAISEENPGDTCNEIIVSSLPLFYKRKDIYDLFSGYGKITSIEMINDSEKKMFHGKALISYETNDGAINALKSLNNIKLSDDSWPLYIQFQNTNADKIEKPQKSIEKNEKRFMNPNSYLVMYGIEIQKPDRKKLESDMHINTKKILENANNEEMYRNMQLENYMFKSIAEDL